ncbi:hypothetical protein RB594_001658 [Gaeumannomyces avenae]
MGDRMKRTYQDEETFTRLLKRPRTIGPVSNVSIHPNHDAYWPPAHEDYTIAWICALPLELAASRAMLDEEHPLPPNHAGDDNTYVLGRLDQHCVVMTCLPGQYGTNNAAIVATNLKRSFPKIRATLMVGIGGGSPSQADLHLGDVVVGTRVMQYDMGKMIAGGLFQETADAKTPARLLNSAVVALRSKHGPHRSSSRIASLLQSQLPNISRPSHSDRLFQASYLHHPLEAPTCVDCDLEKLQPRVARLIDEPRIHYGVIASGNSLVKDGKARDEIAERLSALCFEMETAGMMDNLQCLPVRGICDYSDSHKNKEWQDYAAATAAAYARELLEGLPPSSSTLERTPTCSANASQLDPTDHHALERRQHLLACLDFTQIDARKTSIRAAHTTTCRWLLRHPKYRDWLDPGKQSQTHGFLWMRGKAGAGKSTMTKFLYLEMKKTHKKPSRAVASFFFNARGDYLERSISGMYRSLLLQLLQAFPDLQSVLDDTDIVPRNQQDCPDLNALKELLGSAVMGLGQRCFTAFVDALDECDEQEVRDMVQFFEELAENATDQGIQLRICFSSRPYPYIDIHRGILLALEEELGHGEDLTKYVKSRLKIESASRLEELQSKILDKAAGIFMWVVLVVDILNKESCHGALALKKKLSEIPAKLSDLFREMLIRDPYRTESLQLCILWILFAKRPLTPAEFRHALWAGLLKQGLADDDLPDDTDMDAVKLVTSSSKGLAEITKSKQPTVQFIHESVRDFLLKDKGIQDLWPELQPNWEGPSHEILKRCCTTYLHHPRVQAVVDAPEGGDDEQSDMAEKCSFLGYASQQVLYHANAAAPVVPQDEFLTQFFASAGIKVLNRLERARARQYSQRATPLYVLADRGLGNLIRTQMEREPATEAVGERYRYPLFAALASGHKSAIAALLGLSSTVCDGADVAEGLNYKKDFKNHRGRTPLSWAAQDGRLKMVQLLIRQGVIINEFDGQDFTPLLRAVARDHLTIASFLIAKGAVVDLWRKELTWSPLLVALVNGHEAMARLLISNGADVNVKCDIQPAALILALERGYEATASLLIDSGADVHARDANGTTTLILASKHGHEAITRILLEKGVGVNLKTLRGITALHWASRYGHEATVSLLIDSGADVHARSAIGLTTLDFASQYGHEAIARILVEKGVGVNLRTPHGTTALHWAAINGHTTIARFLIDNGADVNARTADGCNARNKSGWTPLQWASSKGYEATARLLIEKGANAGTQGSVAELALATSSSSTTQTRTGTASSLT